MYSQQVYCFRKISEISTEIGYKIRNQFRYSHFFLLHHRGLQKEKDSTICLHEQKSTGFFKISLEIAPQDKKKRFQSQRHNNGTSLNCAIGSDFCPLCYFTNRRTIRRATREKQNKYIKNSNFLKQFGSIRVQILTKRRARYYCLFYHYVDHQKYLADILVLSNSSSLSLIKQITNFNGLFLKCGRRT